MKTIAANMERLKEERRTQRFEASHLRRRHEDVRTNIDLGLQRVFEQKGSLSRERMRQLKKLLRGTRSTIGASPFP